MTATYACPNGHQSTMADWCDQCGAPIAGPAAATPSGEAPGGGAAGQGACGAGAPVSPSPPSGGTAATGTEGAVELCPNCGAARVGSDRFCEGCGYDFTTGTAARSAGAADGGPAASAVAWDAVVTADRAYFQQVATPGVEFPPHCPDRSFALTGDQLQIGRRSTSRGINPEIDLSGAPEDSAISHLHALLVRGDDGSYSVVDPGSTNGTTVNDNPTPIATNTRVALADGDRIHLGAWTTITIHARGSGASSG